MLMIHFTPQNNVRRVHREGIASSQYSVRDKRADGVYALPLLPMIGRTTTHMWRRTLRQGNGGQTLVAVVFRVKEVEPVYWFDDFTENGFSGRHLLLSAADAAKRMIMIADRTSFSFEEWLDVIGCPLLREFKAREAAFARFNTRFGTRPLQSKAELQEIEHLRSEWLTSRAGGWMGNLPEVVIPRRILASEIVRIETENRPRMDQPRT